MFPYKLLIFIFWLGCFAVPVHAADEFNTTIRYLHVQKGQTLHNIVRRLYPERPKEWRQIKKDIVRLNPHAFINQDPTKMKAGVRLKLPKKIVVRSETGKPLKRKQVGVVAEVKGSVVAVDKRKVSRKLARGNAVYLGDKVVTGEDGFVRLNMIDEAVLDLRCFSIMVIEEYDLNRTSRRSILNLLQGSLRKVTGSIGKMAEDIYELKTPVANVGVRGTEYALRVFQAQGCGGTVNADDGFYLEVIKGVVDVHNEAGKAVIAKGETAYVPLPKTVPQKTAVKPGIVKPAPKPAPAPVVEEEESSSGWWWAVIGVIGIALLL